MNFFTTAQLINHNTGSLYYDSKTGNVNYSQIPTMTMMGYDEYDVTLIGNKKSKNVNKKDTKYREKNIKIKKPEPELKHKKPRKTVIFPDELRCCANTSNGSQCSLKRCTQSGELCYIHYKKTLPKIETQSPVVEKKIKKWYQFWKK